MESSVRDYLHRRYRRATVVMFGGWLAGWAVYGGSYLYAQKAGQAQDAAARARSMRNDPEGIHPSSLPEIDRIALLDLIKAKRQPLTKKWTAVKGSTGVMSNVQDFLPNRFDGQTRGNRLDGA